MCVHVYLSVWVCYMEVVWFLPSVLHILCATQYKALRFCCISQPQKEV